MSERARKRRRAWRREHAEDIRLARDAVARLCPTRTVLNVQLNGVAYSVPVLATDTSAEIADAVNAAVGQPVAYATRSGLSMYNNAVWGYDLAEVGP